MSVGLQGLSCVVILGGGFRELRGLSYKKSTGRIVAVRKRRSKSPRSEMAEDSEGVSQELKTVVTNEFGTFMEYTSLKRTTSFVPPFQSRLNKISKWLVSGATCVVIVWKHNEHALWAGIGAALSGALGKVLKRLINGKRPDSASGRKEDPGMPSSHAQGFMYLSTYASLALLTGYDWSLWTMASACGLILMGAYLSWLRVADGLHTIPQILVGGAVGSTFACFWMWCWQGIIKQGLEVYPTSRYFLLMAAAFAATGYVIFSMRKWRFDQY
ncbi:hypothetical protein R1flu_027340 [Riccia fluitans]|uniref:Phosphatidic acid phosphatase type 2/haloperoxidase domain-containing protein n=1 Tax=Riccia fluitans TaxID=41844 RepID=A0ABD1XIH8_9MARC